MTLPWFPGQLTLLAIDERPVAEQPDHQVLVLLHQGHCLVDLLEGHLEVVVLRVPVLGRQVLLAEDLRHLVGEVGGQRVVVLAVQQLLQGLVGRRFLDGGVGLHEQGVEG